MASIEGSIITIPGPMFGGKTTELLRLIERFRITGKRCLIIKRDIDNRYSETEIVTHSKSIYNKCDIVNLKELDDEYVDSLIKDKIYQVIGIEEAHFFKDIGAKCNLLADNGITVINTVLNGDFEQKEFPEVKSLMAFSDKIIHLTAICMVCYTNEAPFTIRTIKSKELILVGSNDIYKSVCRSCLKKHKHDSEHSNE